MLRAAVSFSWYNTKCNLVLLTGGDQSSSNPTLSVLYGFPVALQEVLKDRATSGPGWRICSGSVTSVAPDFKDAFVSVSGADLMRWEKGGHGHIYKKYQLWLLTQSKLGEPVPPLAEWQNGRIAEWQNVSEQINPHKKPNCSCLVPVSCLLSNCIEPMIQIIHQPT